MYGGRSMRSLDEMLADEGEKMEEINKIEEPVKKRAPRKKKVEEVPVVEVVEQEQPVQEEQKLPILCGLAVVLLENGDLSVQFMGSNQNLVTLDGLLKYAERYLDKQWKPRIEEAQ